jgi:predicted nucleic acid-binding protein
MILVDTSLWIDHLRGGNEKLKDLLGKGLVLSHSMVIGELACGHLDHRSSILRWLSELPRAREASHGEVLQLIEQRQLMNRGIGWVDAHLLAATLLSPSARLWTLDRRLAAVARELGVAPEN